MVKSGELQPLILETLEAKGPRLGKELAEDFRGVAHLPLWQACFNSPALHVGNFATYYLRFDITREDMVRLTPSILRDFLSFTLFGLPGQRNQMVERHGALANTHRDISKQKIAIAQDAIHTLLGKLPEASRNRLCAFVAGDLAYFLAHNEPREHAATGEMVAGSDIDIVLIHDGLDTAEVSRIESEMMALKHFYLRHPDHRHEIDFICKPQAKMEQQFRYLDIHDKIAAKIAYESMFLGGSLELYMAVRSAMKRSGVDELIRLDFQHALEDRKLAVRKLLAADASQIDDETRSLFYFSQERVEFS